MTVRAEFWKGFEIYESYVATKNLRKEPIDPNVYAIGAIVPPTTAVSPSHSRSRFLSHSRAHSRSASQVQTILKSHTLSSLALSPMLAYSAYGFVEFTFRTFEFAFVDSVTLCYPYHCSPALTPTKTCFNSLPQLFAELKLEFRIRECVDLLTARPEHPMSALTVSILPYVLSEQSEIDQLKKLFSYMNSTLPTPITSTRYYSLHFLHVHSETELRGIVQKC